MKGKLLFLTLLLSFSSYSKLTDDQQLERALTSAECLGYMTLFNDEDIDKSKNEINRLSRIFQVSSMAIMHSQPMKDIYAKSIFGRSDVKFSAEFLSGSMLGASREEVTSDIKNKFGGSKMESDKNIRKIWGDEAFRRYSNLKCENIK
ncbi:hypothetical protein NS303_15975 [Pantoea ananatis]|uniref:hypothetical protein n=1 Tax=Pantoea TaxID=53335 RepID=UPI0006CFDB24|nr:MULTISPECIES: hypothetical protein [Pantoea]KTR47281.1 hypothetical protein NS303_15975 [Pantoea ananatis]KTR52547.1 hypothetical protein NS311_20045 [Pantoea ananatis]KTR62950.1 hypothetical protein RSA47_19720 [Pantoea ananatis]KTR72904.1 hypothetical protein NS296_00080 [Pantoea ananatis]